MIKLINWKENRYIMRKLYAVAIMIAMLFLCSGCNKEKEEEMLALREEGIVCMNRQ